MGRRRFGIVLIAWLVIPVGNSAVPLGFVPHAAAAGADCSSLPKSALKPHPCNPQEQCLRLIPRDLQGRALEAARRECHRQPSQGICHGPETYNPQAACLSESKKK